MKVSETFSSIQGEGKLVGVPSFFIRLSGCNLRCVWCDTPYASWRPEFTHIGIDEIVLTAQKSGCRHVVLTGGEPMFAEGISDLANRLKTAGFHITIETAGTIAPNGIACDLASISPKLSNSTPPASAPDHWSAVHESRRLNLPVLKDWLANYSCQFKFVLSGPDDLPEILALQQDLNGIEPSDILLMPEGRSVETMQSRQKLILKACHDYGFRYCDRLHIRLFGNTRGT